MLIVGCGNRERADDAAGLLVIEKLRELGAEGMGATLATCTGDWTELLQSWGPDDEVILVDAVVTGSPPGTVHLWEDELPAAAQDCATSTHGFGIQEALRLARAIGRLPRALRIYGIETRQFETGRCLSREVECAITDLTQKIRTEILATQRCQV